MCVHILMHLFFYSKQLLLHLSWSHESQYSVIFLITGLSPLIKWSQISRTVTCSWWQYSIRLCAAAPSLTVRKTEFMQTSFSVDNAGYIFVDYSTLWLFVLRGKINIFSFLLLLVQWSLSPSLWWPGLSSAEEQPMLCHDRLNATVCFSVSLVIVHDGDMSNTWCHCLLWLLDLDYVVFVSLGLESNKLLVSISRVKKKLTFVKFFL